MSRLTLTFFLALAFSLCQAQVKKVDELTDVSGKITQFKIDNNNKYIAAGNDIGILTIWDFSTREELFKVRPHREEVKFILYNTDKQVITFTSNEITFIELNDGAQSSKISLFEYIEWVDINASTSEIYLLASKKGVSGSKSIYFINLASRKFDVFHSSVSGIESFKTSADGTTMYISKGDEVWVKNVTLDLIDKKLKGHESKIQTIDINPSKPNWLVSTDKYSLKYWKISTGSKYTMKWKPVPTPEDFDKILNAWVLNGDNEILIQGEDGFKIRDVTNPKNETEITSFIGKDVRNVQLSPDKSTILLQTNDNMLGVYSIGEAAPKKPTDKVAESVTSAPTIIESSDEIYKKYKTEIDTELNLRAELFKPRDEFERSADYDGRKAEADSYKAGIFAYYKGLANREAEIEIELALARQRILDDKAKRDSERRASLYQDKIKRSYSEFFTKISSLGSYNPDTEEFPITIDGMTYQVNVPFDKAREFKANYNFCKVVGNQQYLDDATTMDKFNYRIITDEKEVYEFGKQKKPLFIEADKDLLFNSVVARGMIKKTATVAASPLGTTNTNQVKSMDEQIVDYFSTKIYHALLIGVDDYRDQTITQLDGPVNDALRLKRVLKENYTFEEENITLLRNPTRTEIIETFDRLQKEIGEEDNLLIFYAGHGIWDEKLRQGFWLPSDAKRDSKAAWLSNARIRDYIGGIKTKHTLLVADACFSGGIFKSRDVFSKNKASLELAKLPSRKAITSGAMKTVPDKSVFIEYLVKRLDQNEKDLLPAEQLFSSFKIAVMNNSEGQVPQFGDIKGAGDEGGDFIFLRRQ